MTIVVKAVLAETEPQEFQIPDDLDDEQTHEWIRFYENLYRRKHFRTATEIVKPR